MSLTEVLNVQGVNKKKGKRMFRKIIERIKSFFTRVEADFPPFGEVTLDTRVPEARLFNSKATVERSAATVFGADVDGIIDPTNSPFSWADSLWKLMRGNEWAPEEVAMSEDVVALRKLPKELQWSYERALHALIANDSEQSRNLAMSISPYLSDGMVLACINRQAYEEALHSCSYDIMVEDVAIDRERLFSLHNEDEFVEMRATYLEKMYAELAYSKGEAVTVRMIMRALIANNILEGIMFYSGFIFFWALGEQLKGSATMISFIARDERTHIQLFRKMFKSTMNDFKMVDKAELATTARTMIYDATELEKKWLMYIANGRIEGFSEEAIESYMNSKANSIMRGLGFDNIYIEKRSPLLDIEKMYDDPNSLRTNFFEKRPNTYTAVVPTTEGYITRDEEIRTYYPQPKN
jgi:ribonucleoside-diphosphate reductase beta chain